MAGRNNSVAAADILTSNPEGCIAPKFSPARERVAALFALGLRMWRKQEEKR